jgi:fructose-bisphosphate aldolase class II
MLSSVKEILAKAKKENYAIGAFNVSNMEMAQGVVMAAVEQRSPLIVQITENAMKYAGAKELLELVKAVIAERSEKVPIGLNLDHGKTFDITRKAGELGFNGIMIDGSRLSFLENVNLTKRVVDFAHKSNITVQGELGIVPYLGEIDVSTVDWCKLMTDPLKAKEFVESTGVDSLAIAIGNAHGFFREADEADWDRLKQIHGLVNIPLVLHGASDWAKGKIQLAIQGGVTCFNVDTDIRLAFMHELCRVTNDKCSVTDPRKVLGPAREAVRKKVAEKINIFGSKSKA